jgi:hypothetical protein
MELGGLLGSLIAGRISDWYIATSPGGAVGKRIQVVMAYLIGVAAMLAAFQAVPSGKLLSSKYKAELTRYKIFRTPDSTSLDCVHDRFLFIWTTDADWYARWLAWGSSVTISSNDAFIYTGLCGAEIVGRRSVGASEGFLGWIAYLVFSVHCFKTKYFLSIFDAQGAANAGVPLSLLVQQYGWNAFFAALLLACAAAILLLAPITGAQSHIQRSMNSKWRNFPPWRNWRNTLTPSLSDAMLYRVYSVKLAVGYTLYLDFHVKIARDLSKFLGAGTLKLKLLSKRIKLLYMCSGSISPLLSKLACIHGYTGWTNSNISRVLDDWVNQSILLRLKGRHEEVAVSVLHHLQIGVAAYGQNRNDSTKIMSRWQVLQCPVACRWIQRDSHSELICDAVVSLCKAV